MSIAQLKIKLKRLGAQILGALPSFLPVGLTEFNQFADSIIELYNPPGDARSVKFIIATLIMRLGPTEAMKSKLYFAMAIYRGASGQVSAYVMEQLKQEQAAEQRAAQEKAKLEATASQDASNVSKPV